MNKNAEENLRIHVQHLCNELNEAGITPGKTDKWQVRGNAKHVFGGGICYSNKAFGYLKSRGMIDIGVCWKCGKEPIKGDYTFTTSDGKKSYPICLNCYKRGKNLQREFKMAGNDKESSGISNKGLIIFGVILFICNMILGNTVEWEADSLFDIFMILMLFTSLALVITGIFRDE